MSQPDVFARIRACLGCGQGIAEQVLLGMKVDPLWALAHDPETFEYLTWKSFESFRQGRLAGGRDDPAWDLLAPIPIAVEGGAL